MDYPAILESIAKIERFGKDYPKLITDVPDAWKPYFAATYQECLKRKTQLEGGIL